MTLHTPPTEADGQVLRIMRPFVTLISSRRYLLATISMIAIALGFQIGNTTRIEALPSYFLSSNTTAAGAAAGTLFTALSSTGFSIGTSALVNTNSDSYVAWNWKMGVTPGFDMVTYTGTGANLTVSHSLGATPAFILVKRTDTNGDWFVYHSSTGNTGYMTLNSTAAFTTDATAWNNTTPTSANFTVGTNAAVNANGGTYIAYIWSEKAGFSKFGTYTGNGSADGPFVYTGFKPKYFLIKGNSLGTEGGIFDTVRDTYNPMTNWLQSQSNAAASTISGFDSNANGFKSRSTNYNNSGQTFIYAAFADYPLERAITNQGYAIASSTRFNGANASAQRLLSTTGNRRTWTWSGWMKRSKFTGNYKQPFISIEPAQICNSGVRIEPSEVLLVYSVSDCGGAGITDWGVYTSAKLRDPSAWSHVVVAVDTTQAVASDRVKIYFNGVQQAIDTGLSSYPPLNYDTYQNTSGFHNGVGSRILDSVYYFDGYMSEINFLDGLALAPTSFGQVDTNGSWGPISYTGAYGTNGFHLDFANPSDPGNDVSGNNNDFTNNNIATTDNVADTPTNNFPTASPLGDAAYAPSSNVTLSSGNLKVTNAVAVGGALGTVKLNGNKWYWEQKVNSVNVEQAFSLGIARGNRTLTANPGGDLSWWGGYVNSSGSHLAADGANPCDPLSPFASGDYGQVVIDATVSSSIKLWIGKNDTFYDSSCGTTGNPTAGTNPTLTINTTSDLFPYFGVGSANNDFEVNFGQGGQSGLTYDAASGGYFKYTPPTGFKALSSANMVAADVSPIHKPNSCFDAVTYTGNGSAQTISSLNFQPDLVWIKDRTSALDHVLFGDGSTSGSTPATTQFWFEY